MSDEQGAADAETQSKNKKLVGIERFDEERSDEEPCVASRRRSGARQLPKKSLSPTGHEALAKREEQKSGAAANNVCAADTAVLRKIDFETVWKKGKKLVGIERFDEERSDEEPCITSRRRSGARQLPKKSLSPTGHEALAKR